MIVFLLLDLNRSGLRVENDGSRQSATIERGSTAVNRFIATKTTIVPTSGIGTTNISKRPINVNAKLIDVNTVIRINNTFVAVILCSPTNLFKVCSSG